MADGSRMFAAQPGLPATNRGVSGSDSDRGTPVRGFVGIDWFAASVCIVTVLREQGEPCTWELLSDINGYGYQTGSVAACIFAAFFAGTGLVLEPTQKQGTAYKWRYEIKTPDGKKAGQIEFGGAHTMRKDGTQTARIELTAKGCRVYEGEAGRDHAAQWSLLRAKLESAAGQLSRVDLAYDDLDGVYNLAHALKLWAQGKFNGRGQQPRCEHIADLKGQKGDTVYIGSRQSERFMRVYEKGKEQGDELSPWVRWEIVFKHSPRKPLAFDMLTNPAHYMRGAYDALHFISELAARLDVVKEEAAATLKSALKHLRRQYGATLNFLSQVSTDAEALGQFVMDCCRGNKLPEWGYQFLGAEVSASLLDAMRSPRGDVNPATCEEIEELSHVRGNQE